MSHSSMRNALRRTMDLGLYLDERRRISAIGPLDAIDVTVRVAAGVAAYSLWTERGRNFGAVRLPAGASLSDHTFNELAEQLGPYPTRIDAAEATLRRLLACIALLCERSERRT
jgi:hypothetical protein